jgi:hypothetical protein
MTAKLPSVVGKTLFACGYTELYSPDATLDELQGKSRILKQILDVPYLTPLTVTAAKYDVTADGVVFKVKLPDGKDALAISSSKPETVSVAAPNHIAIF